MSDSIYQLLCEKLGLRREDVELRLSEYVQALRARLDKSGKVEIENLGSFNAVDGIVNFEPDESLKQAVNYRYAKLRPIDFEPLEEGPEMAVPESQDPPTPRLPDQEWSRLDEILEDNAIESESDDLSELADAVQPKASPELIRRDRTPKKRGRAGRSIHPALVVTPMIVLGVILIYVFRPSDIQTDPLPIVMEDTLDLSTDTDSIGQAMDLVQPEQEGVTADDQVPDQGTDDAPVATSVEILTRESSGFTMIVASTYSTGNAVTDLSRFVDLGLKMGVLAYEEDNITRYRVAIGQFSTVAEADSMRAALRDRLPEGTWIRRIR